MILLQVRSMYQIPQRSLPALCTADAPAERPHGAEGHQCPTSALNGASSCNEPWEEAAPCLWLGIATLSPFNETSELKCIYPIKLFLK